MRNYWLKLGKMIGLSREAIWYVYRVYICWNGKAWNVEKMECKKTKGLYLLLLVCAQVHG